MGDSLLLAPLEVEGEDLDAFNDETFGGEAAEWEESGERLLKYSGVLNRHVGRYIPTDRRYRLGFH